MDIKVVGVTRDILSTALEHANNARMIVLDKMAEILDQPRGDISPFAPRIISIQINPEKIKDVIGSGGKTIKKIVEVTGAQIDIDDSGRVSIASPDRDACDKAVRIVQGIVEEIEVGKIYRGTVKRILDFGAIVELGFGKDGLVHISELAPNRVNSVTDVIQENDDILVKCISRENDGRIRLSRKQALGEDIENYTNNAI